MTKTLWAGGALLCLASLLAFGFGGNNPNPLRWSFLLVLMTATTACWVWRGMRVPRHSLALAVYAFVVYAGLSLLWSPDWREGFIRYQGVVLLAGLFLAASHANRKDLVEWVELGAAAAIAIQFAITFLKPTIFGGLGNVNFQAEWLVIVAPLALMGWNGRFAPLCIAAGVAALAQAFFFNASDAKYAALAGVAVLALVWAAKNGYRAAAASIGLASLGAVALVFDRFLYSLAFRVEFIINTSLMWFDSLLFGVGLGGFNYTYPMYQERHTQWILPGEDGTAIHRVINFVGAAHNEPLQALATFGLVGCVILGLVVILAPRQNAPALVSLAAAGGLALVGFPMQNAATAVPIVLALALSTQPALHSSWRHRVWGISTIGQLWRRGIFRRPKYG